MRPKAFNNYNTTQMTTTEFEILLMVPCIGMKRFTGHSRMPTTIRTSRICMRAILFFLSVHLARHFQGGAFPACLPPQVVVEIDACVGRGEQALGTGRFSRTVLLRHHNRRPSLPPRLFTCIHGTVFLAPPLLPSNYPLGSIAGMFCRSGWRVDSAP